MKPAKLQSVISMFQMPEGEYFLRGNGEFGESELFWVIKNQNTEANYLLVNTYSHHGAEKEMEFYRDNGFDVVKPILRRFETLENPDDKNDPKENYLFGMYAIFELK